MSPEGAVVIGSVVGAVSATGGALITSWLTPSLQARTEHAHWRRQGRRDVYSAFIGAVMAFAEAADDLMTIMDEEYTPDGALSKIENLKRLLPAIRTSAPVVALAGPEKVAEIATATARLAYRLATSAEFYVTAHRRFKTRRLKFERERALGDLLALEGTLKSFTEKASEALDSRKLKAR
jgi:hypothetical protein